jgi:hypothetical protein
LIALRAAAVPDAAAEALDRPEITILALGLSIKSCIAGQLQALRSIAWESSLGGRSGMQASNTRN